MMWMFIFLILVAGCTQKEANHPAVDAICSLRNKIESSQHFSGCEFVAANQQIAADLNAVTNRNDKIRLLNEWESCIYSMSACNEIIGTRNTVRSVREIARSGIWDSMYRGHFSFDEQWVARMMLLEWMRRQIELARPENYDPYRKESRDLWALYEDAIYWYENMVEMLEFEFSRMRQKNDWSATRIQTYFEKMIGRKIKDAAEIKDLGYYNDVARKRVERENVRS